MKNLILFIILFLALFGLALLDSDAVDTCISKGYSINYCNNVLKGE